MKVQWLNEELTEAIIVRGFLWWRKEACVKWVRKVDMYADDWCYLPSNVRCSYSLEKKMDAARANERRAAADRVQAQNWHSKVKLTPAWDVSSRQTEKPVDKKPGAR